METVDRMLSCRTCGKDFAFTVREQEFFTSKGFDEPRHCPECRAARKREKSAGGDTPQATQTPHTRVVSGEWSEVVCASCGKPASVPFRPTSGRPVYCRDCFSTQKTSEPGKTYAPTTARSVAPSDSRPKPPAPAPVQNIPQHVLEEDMGPLPDYDPEPDEDGEITVADFLPMGSNYGATSEEVNPTFDDERVK